MANIEITRGTKGDGYESACTSYAYITNVPEDQQPSELLWFVKPIRTFWIANPDEDKLWTHKISDEAWKMVDFLEGLGINLDTRQHATHPGGRYANQAIVIAYGNRILVKVHWGYDV